MSIFDFSFGFSKGGGTDVGASKNLMDYQANIWKGNTEWFNKNGYKFLREGLIAADYNPILAIGSSPLSGEMPNATAQQGTESFNASMTPSANMQANTARKLSDSQILVNKATADKTTEEALTQSNIRNNLDAQAALNLLKSEEIKRLLPLKERQMIADILVADSISEMNNQTTALMPKNAESARISANAAKDSAAAANRNATVNEQWTPAKVIAGALAGVGLGGLGILAKGKNIWKGYKTANQINKYKKLGNPTSYYKDFQGTAVH